MIWKLLWLFLVYSFAGWVLETVLASLKQKKFANEALLTDLSVWSMDLADSLLPHLQGN